METNKFFEPLLGLHSPFHISRITHEVNADQITAIHIYITVDTNYRPLDSEGRPGSIHDYESRQWRHLDLFQYPCYVHCEVPKFRYADGSTKTLEVPWARSKSGFTLLFEVFAIELIKLYGCVAKVARQLDIYSQRLWYLVAYYSKKETAMPKDLSKIKQIAFDETSKKKGHNYVSIFLNLETGDLLWVEEGKSAETVTQFAQVAEEQGLNKENITDVSIDFSPAFQAGTKINFINANITFDKFHVSQLVQKAMDSCRKSLGRQANQKFNKWLFLKPYSQLNVDQQDELENLLDEYPQFHQLYTLKNDFAILWKHKQPDEAAAFLAFWIEQIKELKLKATTTLAKTFEKSFDGIIQHFRSNINNAILEGFNSKVQTMKRNARGYKKTETFITMIRWHCANVLSQPTQVI